MRDATMTHDHRNEVRDQPVQTLASTAGPGKVEAGKKTEEFGMASVDESQRREQSLAEFWARVKPIQDYIASFPRTGLKADKAFYDELSGD
ncbi:transcription factor [uncultured Methylobacterium sp.]|uniref:transcription factor n=1 Tax=uncultured Methylobacterium sp. TaxID=157278 RepID=UPI002595C128|nr:transcription factor [uncultured Methylobacterium sp.]